MIQQSEMQTKNHAESTIESIRENILATVINNDAWSKTIQNNSSMKCLISANRNCTPSTQNIKIDLFNQLGEEVVSSQPGRGFNLKGESCTGYNSANPSTCPIYVNFLWRLECTDPISCQYPNEIINVTFEYTSKKSPKPINLTKYAVYEFRRTSFLPNASPVVTCAKQSQVFVGYANPYRDVNGNPHTSNSNGCLPYSFFQGPQGPRGPAGPRGPRGPAGGINTVTNPTVTGTGDPDPTDEPVITTETVTTTIEEPSTPTTCETNTVCKVIAQNPEHGLGTKRCTVVDCNGSILRTYNEPFTPYNTPTDPQGPVGPGR